MKKVSGLHATGGSQDVKFRRSETQAILKSACYSGFAVFHARRDLGHYHVLVTECRKALADLSESPGCWSRNRASLGVNGRHGYKGNRRVRGQNVRGRFGGI